MSYSRLNHRDDYQSCPHCNYKQDHLDWLLDERERNDAIQGYSGIAVLSKCPECGETSWAHYNDVAFEAYKVKLEMVEIK